jgi:hypothetical protein
MISWFNNLSANSAKVPSGNIPNLAISYLILGNLNSCKFSPLKYCYTDISVPAKCNLIYRAIILGELLVPPGRL